MHCIDRECMRVSAMTSKWLHITSGAPGKRTLCGQNCIKILNILQLWLPPNVWLISLSQRRSDVFIMLHSVTVIVGNTSRWGGKLRPPCCEHLLVKLIFHPLCHAGRRRDRHQLSQNQLNRESLAHTHAHPLGSVIGAVKLWCIFGLYNPSQKPPVQKTKHAILHRTSSSSLCAYNLSSNHTLFLLKLSTSCSLFFIMPAL